MAQLHLFEMIPFIRRLPVFRLANNGRGYKAEQRTSVPSSFVTFEQIARYYMAVKERDWGPHNAISAKSLIHKHLIGSLGSKRVDDLGAGDIQFFVNRMIQSNVSQSLLSKVVNHMRAMLDLGLGSGLITRNPIWGLQSNISFNSRKLASNRHLTIAECRALLSELRGRNHLIVRMFIQLGLWPKELFALRRNDVDDEFLRLDEFFRLGRIVSTSPYEAEMSVYIPPNLSRALKSWLDCSDGAGEDWLFPARPAHGSTASLPVHPNLFRNHVLRPAGIRAGLADLDLLTLRRTCASQFARVANAQDVSAQMRTGVPLTRLQALPSQVGVSESLKKAAMAFETELLTSTAAEPSSMACLPVHGDTLLTTEDSSTD